MQYNIITVQFGNVRRITGPLISYQYDLQQILVIEGLELPAYYEVDFCNEGDTYTETIVGTADGVSIPNKYLRTGKKLKAYIVLVGENDVQTRYEITFPVYLRPEREDIDPTPEEQSQIDSLVSALNDGVTRAETAADEAEAAVETITEEVERAEDAADRAEAAADGTEDFAIRAETAAENAETQATNAATSASTATTKAVEAAASAQQAEAAIAQAQQYAANAAQSATSASGSATSAESSARAAAGSATQAGTNAQAASQAATAAGASATNASNSATAAAGSAGTATTQAGIATTKAGEAATSASGAESAKTAAQAAQEAAETAQAAAEDAAESIEESAAQIDQNTEDIATINSALSSLSAVTEIIDTASGAIASFPDGSGLPMRSLVAQINPVQDLHGQSAPYPAGGSKNLFNPQYFLDAGCVLENGYYKGTQSQIATALTAFNADFTFEEDTRYALSYTIRSDANVYLRLVMNYSDSTTSQASPNSSTTDQLASVVSTAGKSVVSISRDYSNAGTVWIKDVQLEKSASVTSFAPYSNICPISGWTGLSGQRTGKNLFDPSVLLEGTGWTESDGVYTGYSSTLFTAFQNGIPFTFKFKENTSYTLSVKSSQSDGDIGGARFIIHYTDNSSSTALSFDSNGGEVSVTSNANKTIARITFNYGSGKLFSLWNVMLCEQSTASTYEPYTGEAISVTFPTTVYGGSDEVIGGNGTSTMGMVDLGDLTWGYSASDTVFYATIADKKDGDAGIICSQYKSGGNTGFSTPDYTVGFSSVSYNVKRIFIGDPNYTDAASFKSAMAGVQLCYQLETPQPFTADPVSIDTLYGMNNIWVDVGAVSVEYPADTKLYIDKRIAELAQ